MSEKDDELIGDLKEIKRYTKTLVELEIDLDEDLIRLLKQEGLRLIQENEHDLISYAIEKILEREVNFLKSQDGDDG